MIWRNLFARICNLNDRMELVWCRLRTTSSCDLHISRKPDCAVPIYRVAINNNLCRRAYVQRAQSVWSHVVQEIQFIVNGFYYIYCMIIDQLKTQKLFWCGVRTIDSLLTLTHIFSFLGECIAIDCELVKMGRMCDLIRPRWMCIFPSQFKGSAKWFRSASCEAKAKIVCICSNYFNKMCIVLLLLHDHWQSRWYRMNTLFPEFTWIDAFFPLTFFYTYTLNRRSIREMENASFWR